MLLHSEAQDQHACTNGNRRHSKILFTCGNSRGRPVFLDEQDPCSYTFQWETDLVCEGVKPSPNEVPCFVEADEGKIIDLSPLVSSLQNWHALDETQATYQYSYYLSVCRPLVESHSLPKGCVTDTAGVCQVDEQSSDGKQNAVFLGDPASPQYSNGEVSITYEMGTPCGNYGVNRKTQIFFTCPTSRAKGLGSPKFREEIQCYYIFDWETTAACTLDTEHSTSSSCSVTDANDNTFDLEPLKGTVFSVGFDDYEFEFGVCGTPVTCDKSRAAVCLTDWSSPNNPKASVIATKTSGVAVSGGSVQVSYKAATFHGVEVDVITTFVCNPEAKPVSYEADYASLVDMDVSDNTLHAVVFQVESALVCVQDIECGVQANGLSYDLSPLVRSSYWRVDAGLYKCV